MLSRVIAKNVGVVFFETQCRLLWLTGSQQTCTSGSGNGQR